MGSFWRPKIERNLLKGLNDTPTSCLRKLRDKRSEQPFTYGKITRLQAFTGVLIGLVRLE